MAAARVCELSDKHTDEPASAPDAITTSFPAMKNKGAVYFVIQTLDRSAAIQW